MAAETNTKIPAPIYAAAAVGDLAYQRLRKLPATVADLRERAAGSEVDPDRLRGAATERVDRLRGAAQRNAAALVTRGQAAQERARSIYTNLVAHGEQVVRGRRVIHATIGVEAKPETPSETVSDTGKADTTPADAAGPAATDAEPTPPTAE